MNRKDLALALLVVTVWGVNFTAIRIGLDGVPPMLLAALRFLLAALPALFFVPLPAVAPRYWIGYGVTAGIGQFGCLFYAIDIGMPAGLASVVMQSQALFTLLFAAVILREPVSSVQVTGLAIAALGLFFIAGHSGGAGSAIPPAALVLTLLGAGFFGVSNVLVSKASARGAADGRGEVDMFSLIVWSSIVPPIPFLLLGALQESPAAIVDTLIRLNGTSILAVLSLAWIATLFGFGAWSHLLSKYPAAQIAPFSLLVPVTGLLSAGILLNERLTASQWGGCLLVLIGLLIPLFGSPVERRYAGAERPSTGSE